LSEDHVKLAIFLAFLAQRTPTGAASANEFLDTFFQSWATFTEFRDDAPAVAARG
jgi:sulfur relay (sulfurtransferase) DsrF/TusC family protein